MNDKKCMALGRQYITACFGTKRQFKFFCEAIGHKIDDEWKSSHVISQKCKVKGCQKTIYVECYLCKEKIDKSMRYQALQKHLGSIHCLEVTKFLRTLDYAEDDENEPDLSHNVCPKEYTFVSEDIDDEYLSTLHSRKLLHPTPNDFVYDEKNMTYKMSITGVETLYGERMGEFKGIYKLLSMCDHGELLFKQCIVPVRGVTVIEDEFIVLFTKMPGSCRGHVLKNVKAAVCLSRALFRALSFLHKHDFVHNAIKPENLFFMEEVVALGGFNVTTHLSTASNLKLQKTQYTPPEESQSFASDLWASGVTLLELVLGKPVTENFVLNEINVPDVHPHLLDLIQQLLSIDPDKRGSAEEILASNKFLNFLCNQE